MSIGLYVLRIIYGKIINKIDEVKLVFKYKGEFIKETVSSDGKYTIKAYLCNGGATTDYAVRGELINNSNDKVKNIFWQYRVSDANFTWVDTHTVKINGHEIDLPNGKYDWRND